MHLICRFLGAQVTITNICEIMLTIVHVHKVVVALKMVGLCPEKEKQGSCLRDLAVLIQITGKGRRRKGHNRQIKCSRRG